jgi:predicted Zn-dependent peptidase
MLSRALAAQRFRMLSIHPMRALSSNNANN